MYFCDDCYKLVHEKQKNNKHIKEHLDYYVPMDIKCPQHPKCLQNLFCLDENGKYFYLNK